MVMKKIINLQEKAHQIKKDIPAVFMAFKNPATPLSAKVMAALTVGYALSPLDLIPDFIPVLGYLDDVLLLPLMITFTLKLIPKDIWIQARKDAEHLWEDGKPKKWYFGIPVILIWLLFLGLIIKSVKH